MSAGPTTRPIGNLELSCWRRCSIWSPSSDADSGVSTKPAAIRLTRTGASSIARFFVSAGPAAVERADQREPGARATGPGSADEQQGPSGTHRLGGVPGDVHRQPQVGIDIALARFEVEIRQRRVVGPGTGHEDMVDRRRQLVEEPAQPFEIEGVEGDDARPELETDPVQAVRIARREDHIRSLGAGVPGGFKTDPRAAADHDDPLPSERRAVAGGHDGRSHAARSRIMQSAPQSIPTELRRRASRRHPRARRRAVPPALRRHAHYPFGTSSRQTPACVHAGP